MLLNWAHSCIKNSVVATWAQNIKLILLDDIATKLMYNGDHFERNGAMPITGQT